MTTVNDPAAMITDLNEDACAVDLDAVPEDEPVKEAEGKESDPKLNTD